MCGVGAKSVAHFIKFHLLQWEVAKVKFFFLFFIFYLLHIMMTKDITNDNDNNLERQIT